ncbi:DUF2461 domain-containing protein [Oscillibacter sp. MSJ-2]|uniref:DUF2461 domain-containing protein n=1 Tax=Dysosmobacter acutus TaxID=2841504 RepID=A0ABS6F920_9FIRM|nr:DUF2461 domain-containing protein [Dysosmobacter acutus]MBU5625794.1 DUF2461 domain-containing protein [Dysosmobacter acutus]
MFQGFDDATVDFMWGIRFNNEKPWFEANKQTYLDHFYTPMRYLADEVYAHLSEKCPDYGLICRVSRIYRDARRLFGRGPYKDHLWFSVERPGGAWSVQPCFWFELGPESWGYGLGYYSAQPVTMMKLRARMDANPAPMEKLTRSLSRQSEFQIEGEEYKKPKAQAPSALLAPWYRKKNFSISHNEALSEELFHRQLLDRLIRGYDFLIPYYGYFVTLEGDPDPRET